MEEAVLNIYLYNSTDLHEIFFENAQEVDRECERVDDMAEADVIVIDNAFKVSEVYREGVIIAVVGKKLPGPYPVNVIFVETREEIQEFIRIAAPIVKRYILS